MALVAQQELKRSSDASAARHTCDLAPAVYDIQANGHTSVGAITDHLNARGMLTRRGERWHKSTVMNLLERLEACANPA
jgi:recombinase